ncbi:hypothetical protein RJ641_003387 [Dillenia turbinata]|uniref:Uncharacterized protein n=1 Tax=Dillenia turbinata TaxID=194707 RepID=A0AAN8VH38_9MAGN
MKIFVSFQLLLLILICFSLSSSVVLSHDSDHESRKALKSIFGLIVTDSYLISYVYIVCVAGEENFGRWENGVLEGIEAPAPGPDGEHTTLMLAAKRTNRPDILRGFKRYHGGWNITNRHYWASVGFTGAAAFILAILWFVSFGLALVVHHFCGWRIDIKGKGSNRSKWICLALLILFTCATALPCLDFAVPLHSMPVPLHPMPSNAKVFLDKSKDVISCFLLPSPPWDPFSSPEEWCCTLWDKNFVTRVGCILLSVGQDEFYGESVHTLNYVVNQSDYTVETLRNVTEYLNLAKRINIAQVNLPQGIMDEIDKLNVDLNNAANMLTEKTSENSAKIRKVFNAVRSALITLAAVMLLLALLGLVLSVLGHQHAIHIFIISGWFLVAMTIILCGVFVILSSAISDTCTAMGEWVDNPQAETALSNILPCVDERTTNQTLIQSKQIITSIVMVVNEVIYSVVDANPPQGDPNYYNQSGPQMPPLCYPFDAQLQEAQCGSWEVSTANASEVWKNYTCTISDSGLCTSVGRVKPAMYQQLVTAVIISYALQRYAPPLLSFQNCNFVRETFKEITSEYCPPLKHYLQMIDAGLGLISGGIMLCLLLWLIYASRPPREEVLAKLSLPINFRRKGSTNHDGSYTYNNSEEKAIQMSSTSTNPESSVEKL